MRKNARSLIRPAAVILVMGVACGEYPSSVDSAAEVAALDVGEAYLNVRGLADTDIPSLSRLQDLTSLDFMPGWPVEEAKLTDHGLALLADLKLPALRVLGLGRCHKITDAGMIHVRRLSTLESVSLSGNPQITDAAIRHLVEMAWLRCLALEGTSITDQGLELLLSMENLEDLDFRGCENITDLGVQKLESLTSLKDVFFGENPDVDIGTIVALQRALPDCRVRLLENVNGSWVTDEKTQQELGIGLWRPGGEAR